MTATPPVNSGSPQEETATPSQQITVKESVVHAIPSARIRENASGPAALFRTSRMWWATLICLLAAIWMAWLSLPSSGPTLWIRFPEGHGLKTGDVVRHRGIDVGQVQEIVLSDDLSEISVKVALAPGAAGLGVEDSRFWIVRPQLSLTGVSPLETAVGSKYIGVSPGDPTGDRRTDFQGLAIAPPDDNSLDGLDLVLRGDATHGVTVGAPVAWRGVDVGQILAVDLSPDARFVDVHIRIRSEHRRLVRSTSRFWVSSGLGVDVGLTGIRFNADSLNTIVRGGVSFTTPATTDTPEEVHGGQMFTLYREPADEWLSSESLAPLVDFALPETVTIRARKMFSTLGIHRRRTVPFNGILIRSGDQLTILSAAELGEIADSYQAEGVSEEDQQSAFLLELGAGPIPVQLTRIVSSAEQDADQGSCQLLLQFPKEAPETSTFEIRASRLRHTTEPEDCGIARRVLSAGSASSVIHSIGRDQLQLRDGRWWLTSEPGDATTWNGAPVLSLRDGKVIGVFHIAADGHAIALLPQQRPLTLACAASNRLAAVYRAIPFSAGGSGNPLRHDLLMKCNSLAPVEFAAFLPARPNVNAFRLINSTRRSTSDHEVPAFKGERHHRAHEQSHSDQSAGTHSQSHQDEQSHQWCRTRQWR
ncbi:MAG: MCE family protein, partial [Planctomycetaceae bacterium]|nr:MCE family protein [Planctomycetaceae bacterium]